MSWTTELSHFLGLEVDVYSPIACLEMEPPHTYAFSTASSHKFMDQFKHDGHMCVF